MANLFSSCVNLLFRHFCFIFVGGFLMGGVFYPIDQTLAKANATPYRSSIDSQLTVQKVSVLPFTDNMGGIYARPLEDHLTQLVDKNHHWTLTPAHTAGPLLSTDELEANPENVKSVSTNLDADGFFTAKITKGPKGVSIRLDLFLTVDHKLFAQAEIKDEKIFDIESLKDKTTELYSQISRKIPYQGLILSRQGQRVTVNLGKNDGVEKGRLVSVIQIIKVSRHPKFQFLINTEKEILGKVKLLKVDETLSFGKIISEKEKGAIQRHAKVSGLDFVTYENSNSLTDSNAEQDDLAQRPDHAVSFGSNPQAWVPQKPPTFGKVGARLGLGIFNMNKETSSAGNLTAKNPYYPSVAIDGELWLTTHWSIHALLKQGIVTIDNPESGSSPSELSQSLNVYELLAGYNFRLSPSLWGPQVQVLGGYSYYRLFVDDSTTGSLTTMQYTGFKMGLRGQYPITANQEWSLGAQLFFYLKSNLSESPSSSGTVNRNTINQFSLFGIKKLSPRLMATASLDFELYSTTFSSGSASSSSHKHTTLAGGIYYMF